MIRQIGIVSVFCIAWFWGIDSCLTYAEEEDVSAKVYKAMDTFSVKATKDQSPDVRKALNEFNYKTGEFSITVTPNRDGRRTGQSIVSYPSPRPDLAIKNKNNPKQPKPDAVYLEWYRASPQKGQKLDLRRPAVLLLHSLDPRLIIARGLARGIHLRGIHVFVIHMPGYGRRRVPGAFFDGASFFARATQAVADARRARDAIAALPGVDPKRISIQGTSLGGFIATPVASLDNAFANTFIVLAGGNLFNMFQTGQREAKWIRQSLERAGFKGDRLKELCFRIEPTRLAHRLNPKRTWLFSAMADQVVPTANAKALATAMAIPKSHHHWVTGDHYSSVFHIRWIIEQMIKQIRNSDDGK